MIYGLQGWHVGALIIPNTRKNAAFHGATSNIDVLAIRRKQILGLRQMVEIEDVDIIE